MVKKASTQAGSSSGQPEVTADEDVNYTVPSDSRPAKKARASESAGNAPGTSVKRRRKERLGDLSDLPLDIWHEVFLHLDPADLLHLARATKAFRKELLSHRLAFVWQAALDRLDPEYWPPCPADISKPAWVNLVWGGPYCSTCNGKAVKIAWNLRRRICKACADKRLRGTHLLFELDKHRKVYYTQLLPYVDASAFKSRKSKYARRCVWEDDYRKIEGELRRIQAAYPHSTTEWDAFVQQCVVSRKAIERHAELCSSLEEKRNGDRSRFLSGTKTQRVEAIQGRLRDLGYDAVDIASQEVQTHKDVKVARPLTDKIWLRIQPSLRSAVEAARDRRLTAIKARCREERIEMATGIYLSLLRLVAPSTVSFMPVDFLLKFKWIADAIETDSESSEKTFETIEDAVYGSLTDIEQWMFGRAQQLQELLPEAWKHSLSNTEPEHPGASVANSRPKLLDFYDSFAPHDLAVYTFECYGLGTQSDCSMYQISSKHSICFGLDALALQCCHVEKDVFPVRPNQRAYNAALYILGLLGLDPARTSPLELDLLQKSFICDDCKPPLTEFQPLTWRNAVNHYRSEAHLERPPNFRCATPLESLYIKIHHFDPEKRMNKWGCVYCSAHFGRAHGTSTVSRCWPTLSLSLDRWFTYAEVKRHLKKKHRIRDVVEGRDLFTNRQHQHLASGAGLPKINLHSFASVLLWDLEQTIRRLSSCERIHVYGDWDIEDF